MNIEYRTSDLEKKCNDLRKAKKTYGPKAGEKLCATINFIKSATCLQDVNSVPLYHLHPLSGSMKDHYSIYVNKTRPACRLIFLPLDNNKRKWATTDISIIYNNTKNIFVEEVSNQHYE